MEPSDPNPNCPWCGVELDTTIHDTRLTCFACEYEYDWTVTHDTREKR